MKLSEADLAALLHASRMCICESYYNYQCGKCRDKIPPATDALVDAGLITWKGYSPPNLTEAGRRVWDKERSDGEA